jgi:hypothetical protein
MTVRILLTVVAFEFFGPAVRDLNASHALNPDWVGHARFHLVWQLAFMALSGVANLWLIWWRRPRDVRDLWLSVLWQSFNLGAFWVACLLAGAYGGAITLPDTHVYILGIDENVVVFTILTVVLAAAAVLLARSRTRDGRVHPAKAQDRARA